MMRLKSLNCPNCLAPLDFSPGQTLCICLYCNSTIRIQQDTAQPQDKAQVTAVTEITTADMAHIRELLLAGQTETAVQRYQQLSGSSQSEAQAAITTLSNQISFSTFRQQQLSMGGFVIFGLCVVGLIWAIVGGFAGTMHPGIVMVIAAFALLNLLLFGKGFVATLRYLRADKGAATVLFLTRIGDTKTGRRTFHVFRVILAVQPKTGSTFQAEMLLPVRDKSVSTLHQGTRFEVKFFPGDETSLLFNKLLPGEQPEKPVQ